MKIMELNNKLVWGIRILISGLFLLSVFAKFYPSPNIGVIKYFENGQLVNVLGFPEYIAPFISRLIIAFELFLAIAILQPHFLKRIIIPASIIVLVGFSIHLIILIFQGSDGNCGCFGELIPMTPLQALIKNILTIGALIYLFKRMKPKVDSNKFVLPGILGVTTLFMFIYVPLNAKESINKNAFEKKMSIYSKYVGEIDEGEKLLCFFVPDCDHCQEAAKEIIMLATSMKDFPEVKIVFMDEEPEKIPKFFEFASSIYDYQIMDIHSFIEVFWNGNNDTPGVIYMNNGNVIKFYQGTKESGSEEVFDSDNLKELLEAR